MTATTFWRYHGQYSQKYLRFAELEMYIPTFYRDTEIMMPLEAHVQYLCKWLIIQN